MGQHTPCDYDKERIKVSCMLGKKMHLYEQLQRITSVYWLVQHCVFKTLMDKQSNKCCWNHSNVIIVLKFVLLLNGVNISIGGNGTLDSLWAVWLLNSLWSYSPGSFGRHMHCQVPLGKEMSFQLVIQHLWLPATPQAVCAVILGLGTEASPQSQFCAVSVW